MEICKELVQLATRCCNTKASAMTPELLQEIVDSLYQAATWMGISEISHREDRAVIAELRRLVGDEQGRIMPSHTRGYSSPKRKVSPPPMWDALGKVKMEA